MTTKQIAGRLVKLIRQKAFLQAQRELFAEHAINREPEMSPSPSVTGLAAILDKETRFLARVETWHRVEVSEPLITANFFTVRMHTDVTLKNQQRFNLDELCVYEVKDGKIISEQFFY